MSTYFLKQPDGRFAVFSKVLNKFTFCALSEEEAIGYASARWGRPAALEMIADASAELPIEREIKIKNDGGLVRWWGALSAIAAHSGMDGLKFELSSIGFEDADVPKPIVKRAKKFA